MQVTFTMEVSLPDVEVERIVFDEWGNAELLVSGNGAQAKCRLDACGSDHGTIMAALLSLAGIQIASKNEVIFKCPNTNWQARRTSATM